MRLYIVKSVSARQSLPRLSPDEFRHKYISEMQQRLNLTPDQVTAINHVLDETRSRFRQIHERVEPELKQLRQEQSDRVRSLLTAQQQPEYDRWRAEREKNR